MRCACARSSRQKGTLVDEVQRGGLNSARRDKRIHYFRPTKTIGSGLVRKKLTKFMTTNKRTTKTSVSQQSQHRRKPRRESSKTKRRERKRKVLSNKKHTRVCRRPPLHQSITQSFTRPSLVIPNHLQSPLTLSLQRPLVHMSMSMSMSIGRLPSHRHDSPSLISLYNCSTNLVSLASSIELLC